MASTLAQGGCFGIGVGSGGALGSRLIVVCSLWLDSRRLTSVY